MIKLNRYATLRVPNKRTENHDEHGNFIPPTLSDKIIWFQALERDQEIVHYEEGSRIGNDLKVIIRFDKSLLIGNVETANYRFIYNEVIYKIISVSEYVKEGRNRYLELYLSKEV